MSNLDTENLLKIQELSAAAVGLSEELEVAETLVKQHIARAAEVKDQLVEVKRALCGLVASTVEADLHAVIGLEKE